MTEEYNVIFTGKILEGLDIELVKYNIASKVNLTIEQVNNLFESAPRSIKKLNTQEKANELIAIIKGCGAIAQIEITENCLSNLNLPDNINNNKITEPNKPDEETVNDIVKNWGATEWISITIGIIAAIWYFSSPNNTNKQPQNAFTISANSHLEFDGNIRDLAGKSNSFKAYDMQTGEFIEDIVIRNRTVFITDSVGNEYKGNLHIDSYKNMDCLYADKNDQFGQRKYLLCKPLTNINKQAASYSGKGSYNAKILKNELVFIDQDFGGGFSGPKFRKPKYEYYRFLQIN